jgi:hypothetical protein
VDVGVMCVESKGVPAGEIDALAVGHLDRICADQHDVPVLGRLGMALRERGRRQHER